MADKNKAEKFDDVKLRSLAGIYHGDGFQVVLDIMEEECNKAENEFLAEHPVNPQAVLAAHAILHAQRAYFQAVVRKIDGLMNEYMNADKDNRRFPSQLEQLLSANPLTEN